MEITDLDSWLRQIRNAAPWPAKQNYFYLSAHCRECPCRGLSYPLLRDCILSDHGLPDVIDNNFKNPGTAKLVFKNPNREGIYVHIILRYAMPPPYKIITGWQTDSPDRHTNEPACTNPKYMAGELKSPPCKIINKPKISLDASFKKKA